MYIYTHTLVTVEHSPVMYQTVLSYSDTVSSNKCFIYFFNLSWSYSDTKRNEYKRHGPCENEESCHQNRQYYIRCMGNMAELLLKFSHKKTSVMLQGLEGSYGAVCSSHSK